MDGSTKKKLPDVGDRIFGGGRSIGLAYRTSPPELEELAGSGLDALGAGFAAALARVCAAEQRSKRCLIGPQRDDIDVTFDGRPVGSFASAGEQRRTAFVLVMAAIEIAAMSGGAAKVVLVDDVEAEFDDERLDRVLGFLGGATQTLVATSKRNVAERYASMGRVLYVENGRFREGLTGPALRSQGASD